MRELNLDISKDRKPYYLRLSDSLRNSIKSGRLLPGEPLPSTRVLAENLGVHRHTVMVSLQELEAEGWVTASEKKAYVVSQTLPSKFFEPLKPVGKPKSIPLHKFNVIRDAGFGAPVNPEPHQFKHSFQSGLPDLRLFPMKEFRSLVSETLRKSAPKILGYTDAAGFPPLISELDGYLRHIRGLSGRKIIITHGSQEAIFLTSQLLVQPGDSVAVEALGYLPAWEAIRAAGATLVPVEIDNEGLVPESLEAAIKDRQVRLIYITPLHQYPTTVTMPLSRRVKIYNLAARYGVPILEDDYDHEFHYRSQPLAPLAVNDPGELVVYVSTFSKILFPSVRIGFMAVPERLYERFSSFRRIMTRQNETILQDSIARWMKTGGFERHLRRMRRTYHERRDVMSNCIGEQIQAGLPIKCSLPDGGMAVWLDTGMNSDLVAADAQKHGVYVMAESKFSLSRTPGRHLRLGFANQSPREIRAGMEVLFRAIGSCQ